MNHLIPIYLDQAIIDWSRLERRFGNLRKKFNNYKEMEVWIKKARKLNKSQQKKK